ncbi:MAG: hypothetical protein NAG76_20225 [Candidatus Pristimantibacillus lignocellulolyticus]|uniref:Uncharacterized protein n=1 Tax=Candidatus Pristimantibacillus lignocellulolyticus TaxID=2994561 RepID=A0A9J6ZDL2_9BACL|nr:MAG: hypothetical protein NAG76_20225 [Candidatus Pristimantibacillus lignocellulolyticus]
MNKVLIIGSVASGKTTLARQLSKKLNIPWYELDSIVYHQTALERYKRSAAEQVETIIEINQNGDWIFEGVDRLSYQCLYEMADTIVFLDTPLWKRKIRIFSRFVKQQLGIEKSNYTSDLKMLRMMYQWTQGFENDRAQFEAKLQLFESKVIRLHNNNEMIMKL